VPNTWVVQQTNLTEISMESNLIALLSGGHTKQFLSLFSTFVAMSCFLSPIAAKP